jgi:hypothetical protein
MALASACTRGTDVSTRNEKGLKLLTCIGLRKLRIIAVR